MSTQELREQIQKKMNTVEDKEVLKQALAALNGVPDKKYIDLFKHADRIMKEDENLLRRLAE